MNIILAIETSTTRGSVAVLLGGGGEGECECAFSESFTSERSHNSQIFGPLGKALEIATPDLIVVGTGPGSYTGARIGIAAGIGISLSSGARLIGQSSLAAAELKEGPTTSYRLVGDARRGNYFYAEIENRQLQGEPQLIDRDQLEEVIAESRETGVTLITFDPAPPANSEGITTASPSAELLARNATTLSETQIAELADAPTIPHYMSAPFTTQPKQAQKK